MLRASFASFPFSSSSFRNNHPRWKSPRYPLGNSTNTPNGLSSSSSSSNEIRIDSPGWSAGYGTGGKIWLSSKVLAEYLLKQEEEEEEEEAFYNTNTRNVLELGCGTGYAGIFAAKYYEAKETKTSSLTLTDGGTEALLRLCEENARQNGIDDVLACKYEWGRGTMCSSLRERVKRFPPDLILGSDCTYERKAHEDLCESIAELLELAARGRERGKNEEAKRRGNERAKDSSSSSSRPSRAPTSNVCLAFKRSRVWSIHRSGPELRAFSGNVRKERFSLRGSAHRKARLARVAKRFHRLHHKISIKPSL